MRILQTPVRFFPAIGGVESVVLGLSRALAALGHDVTVVCSDEPSREPRSLDGVSIRRLKTAAKLANTNITPGLPLELLRLDFDVVHTHLPTPWSADWSAWLGRLRGRGVIVSYYNDIVGQGAAGVVAGLYNATLLRILYRAAHRFITLTPEHMSSPGSRLKPVWHKTSLLQTGVDTAGFQPQPDLRTPGQIGFLAVLDTFHRYKGLDVLLRALRRLADRGVDARLSIGGDGALRGEYERLAASLQLGDRAHFLGRLPDEGLAPFFNACSTFVLPSISGAQEGYGLVALEAMACGVPIVTTTAAGIAPIVRDAQAGLVVPPGDDAALADAIEHVLGDAGVRRHMGGSGRGLVESRFSWRAVAEDYVAVYRSALGR